MTVLTSPDSVQTVQQYYQMVDSDDVDGLLALFAPDAVYHRPGYPPLTGHADLERFYRGERVIETGRHTLQKVVADGTSVATYGEFNGTLKDGRTASLRFADFFTVRPDGQFSRRDTFFYSPMV